MRIARGDRGNVVKRGDANQLSIARIWPHTCSTRSQIVLAALVLDNGGVTGIAKGVTVDDSATSIERAHG
jgi:hypothetical protein